MSKRGRITSFIVDGADFFTANLDNNYVRIGMVGDDCFDFPVTHRHYSNAKNCTNEQEVEDLYDMIFGEYAR